MPKAHPELLGALVQTATLDFHARDLVTTIGTLIDEVERLGMNVGPNVGADPTGGRQAARRNPTMNVKLHA